jgi:Spy/CpxP family protein refolding chaperone
MLRNLEQFRCWCGGLDDGVAEATPAAQRLLRQTNVKSALAPITSLLLLISLVCVAVQCPLRADDAPAENDPATLLDRIKSVTEQLDLNPDQRTQIESAFKKAADDLQAAREELQNASPDEKLARFRDLLTDLRQQVGQVLTADQKAELQQRLQSLRNSTTTPSDQGRATRSGTAAAPRGDAPAGRESGQNGQRMGGPGRGMQFIQRLKNNLDQLGLNADQQSQVDALVKDVQQQIQTLRAGIQNGSLERSTAREQIRSMVESTRTKLGNILTPDQQEKLLELMQPGQSGAANRPPFPNRPPPQNTATPPPAPVVPRSAAQPAAKAAAPVPPAVPAVVGPAIGQPAPDFSLKALNGESVGLSSYNHKLLVLVLGSYTNPSFRDRAAGLELLRNQYGGRGVNFLIIYTRETHPTGGWEVQRNKTDNIDIVQPGTESQRASIAQRAKTALNLSILMATDTMDNKTATAYAVGDGTPAYLIGRDGKILFHQSWLEPMALGDAIEAVLK